jgi:hypothetical protein
MRRNLLMALATAPVAFGATNAGFPDPPQNEEATKRGIDPRANIAIGKAYNGSGGPQADDDR